MRYLNMVLFILSVSFLSCQNATIDITGIFVDSEFELIEIYKSENKLIIEIHDREDFKGIIHNDSSNRNSYHFQRDTYNVTIEPKNKNNQVLLYLNYQCRGCKKNNDYFIFSKMKNFANEKDKKDFIKRCSVFRKVPYGSYITNNADCFYSMHPSSPEVIFTKYNIKDYIITKIEQSNLDLNDDTMSVVFDKVRYKFSSKMMKIQFQSWWFDKTKLAGLYRQPSYYTFRVGENIAPVRYKLSNVEIIYNKKITKEDKAKFINSELIFTQFGIFIRMKHNTITLPLTIDGGGYSEHMTIEEYDMDRDKYYYKESISYGKTIVVSYGLNQYSGGRNNVLLKDYGLRLHYVR